MPELPEVESIAQAIRRALLGARVTRVSLHRGDVLTDGQNGAPISARSDAADRSLLLGGTIAAVHRLGKQIALEVDDGRVLVVQLGMSGRLLLHAECAEAPTPVPHTHATWTLDQAESSSAVHFADPRRFGGLIAFPSLEMLQQTSWNHLGPDALTIAAAPLRRSLDRSKRAIKALLLDQSVIAGIGNIYADEILHRTRIHPLHCANQLADHAALLSRAIRSVLARAVELGGSTIRDYVDAAGNFGGFQREHRVYGRNGQPCLRTQPERCMGVIGLLQVAGRTTAFCPRCQPEDAATIMEMTETGRRVIHNARVAGEKSGSAPKRSPSRSSGR